MARFAKISAIDPARPASWQDKLFLTVDVDWASDAVIADTIDVIEAGGGEATWFITHDTPLLDRLRANPRFELGIHPNFNFLLQGRPDNGVDQREVLHRIHEVVPEARSVRSHSMTQSTLLLDLFAGAGLTHDCNHFVPWNAGVSLQPWRHWNGMTRIPYFWEDDIASLAEPPAPIEDAISRPGLRVFDFHPIHVFLNTERPERYSRARPHLGDSEALKHLANRSDAPGARDWLGALLGAA